MRRLETCLVIKYVRGRRSGRFTTDDVARKFGVRRQQAAATVAIMRIMDVVKRADPPTRNGSSQWLFTG